MVKNPFLDDDELENTEGAGASGEGGSGVGSSGVGSSRVPAALRERLERGSSDALRGAGNVHKRGGAGGGSVSSVSEEDVPSESSLQGEGGSWDADDGSASELDAGGSSSGEDERGEPVVESGVEGVSDGGEDVSSGSAVRSVRGGDQSAGGVRGGVGGRGSGGSCVRGADQDSGGDLSGRGESGGGGGRGRGAGGRLPRLDVGDGSSGSGSSDVGSAARRTQSAQTAQSSERTQRTRSTEHTQTSQRTQSTEYTQSAQSSEGASTAQSVRSHGGGRSSGVGGASPFGTLRGGGAGLSGRQSEKPSAEKPSEKSSVKSSGPRGEGGGQSSEQSSVKSSEQSSGRSSLKPMGSGVQSGSSGASSSVQSGDGDSSGGTSGGGAGRRGGFSSAASGSRGGFVEGDLVGDRFMEDAGASSGGVSSGDGRSVKSGSSGASSSGSGGSGSVGSRSEGFDKAAIVERFVGSSSEGAAPSSSGSSSSGASYVSAGGLVTQRQIEFYRNLGLRSSYDKEKVSAVLAAPSDRVETKEQRALRERVLRQGIAGKEALRRGSKAQVSTRDLEFLRFLALFRFANARHMAKMYSQTTKTASTRLNKLRDRGLVFSNVFFGRLPTYFLSEAGMAVSGYSYKVLSESDISLSSFPHMFGINHVAAHLMGANVDVLGFGDEVWPTRNRRVFDERLGRYVKSFGEMLVSEYEIQSALGRRRLNSKSEVYKPEAQADLRYAASRWLGEAEEIRGLEDRAEAKRRMVQHVYSSPEMFAENEWMWALFPENPANLAHHVPDLVVKRPRKVNGAPTSIAVELELTLKNTDQSYVKSLTAYKNDEWTYGEVVWISPSKTIRTRIEKIAREVGLWRTGRIRVVPLYSEYGEWGEKEMWKI